MSRRTLEMSDALRDYIFRVSVRESDVLRRLRHETSALKWAGMQISPEQGQLMKLLVELLGARRAIEIGVFTGYSSLCVATALPPDGQLVACDVNEEWTAIARRYWREAGVDDRIDLRLAPALETLDALLARGDEATYDFAFVDADKESYVDYYDRCLRLVRPGGLVAFDNVLWGGKVADFSEDSASTRAIRELNERLSTDDRVTISLVPIGDGLMLARRRASTV